MKSYTYGSVISYLLLPILLENTVNIWAGVGICLRTTTNHEVFKNTVTSLPVSIFVFAENSYVLA